MRSPWLSRCLPLALCLSASAIPLIAQDSSPARAQAEAPSLERARKLTQQGQFANAEKELAQLVASDVRDLGEQNPKTLTDGVALAVARGKAGNTMDAEAELRRLLNIFNRRQGPEQDATLRCRTALGSLLDDVGRPREAVTEYRQVLETRQRISGADDLEAARVQHMLGDALTGSKNFVEAIDQYSQSERVFEKVLGPEKAETLLNRSNLAMAKNSHLDFDGAEKDLKDILTIRERLLGENDHSVLATCYYLAQVLQNQKKYAEALTFATRSMEGWRKTLSDSSALFQKAAQLCTELQLDLTHAEASKNSP